MVRCSRAKGRLNTARPARCPPRPTRLPGAAAGVAPGTIRRWPRQCRSDRPRRAGHLVRLERVGHRARAALPLRHRHARRLREVQHRRSFSATAMKSCQIGPATAAPVSLLPSDAGLSKPTQTTVTRSGVKPANQASLKSCDVPVLPAIGRPRSLRHRHAGAALHHALHHGDQLEHALPDRRSASAFGRPAAAACRIAAARRSPARSAARPRGRPGPARCRSASASPAARLRRSRHRRRPRAAPWSRTAPSAAGSTRGMLSTSWKAIAVLAIGLHADVLGHAQRHQVQRFLQRDLAATSGRRNCLRSCPAATAPCGVSITIGASRNRWLGEIPCSSAVR